MADITTFVGDFRFPCGVHSALWLIQQANPTIDVFNLFEAWDINLFFDNIGIVQDKETRQDYAVSFELLYEYLQTSGIFGLMIPDINMFYLNADQLVTPTPLDLVNRGLVDPNVFTVVHYPGHWVVIGPELSPETRGRFGRVSRRNGWFGPIGTGPLNPGVSILRVSDAANLPVVSHEPVTQSRSFEKDSEF